MLNFKALINSQEPDKFRIKTLTMSAVQPPCAFIIAILLTLEISAFKLEVKDLLQVLSLNFHTLVG